MTEIRRAVISDAASILDLIRELAEYERALDQVICTVADLERDGFGPNPKFECLVARTDGRTVGFALYFFKWSTWTGSAALHLEDLYVTPAYRGRQIGYQLLKRLATTALERGCDRFEWEVLDWNHLARDFYHALGAKHKEGWLGYRIEGGALRDLAKRGT